MAYKLITSVRKADMIVKNVNFTGNFKTFAQVQPKRLELRQFLSQLSSHPPKGFDKPFSQRKDNKSGACTTGGIRVDQKFSSLSGGTGGRERDGRNRKGGPGSGGKSKRRVFICFGIAGILGVCWVYLNHKVLGRSMIESESVVATVLKILDEAAQKGSNVPSQQVTDGKNEKESVPAHLAELVNKAKSTDSQIQYGAVNSLRKLLTSGRNPPIDFLIRCNILPTLVECLSSQNSALQLDALGALTRVVRGTSKQTQAVVEAGAVPHFLRLLTSPHQNARDFAIEALGSILVDGPQLRDCVINLGVVAPLLNCIQPDTPINFVRKVGYTIALLCLHRGTPLPHQTVQEILPTLNVLAQHNDQIVLLVTVWALKFLTDCGKEQIQMVIESGVLPKLLQLLNSGEGEVQKVATRAFNKIITGADGQKKAVLNCVALSHLHNLVKHPKEAICRWALAVLAVLIAKKFATVQAIRDAGLIPLIVHHLEQGELQLQKGAAWVVYRITISGNKEQVAHLLDCGVIPLLCNLLNCKDSGVVHIVLIGIHNILAKLSVNQNGGDKVRTMMKECGGLDKIKTLQSHDNAEISKIAHKIILMGFFSDDVEENAYLVPNASEMLQA